MTAQLHGEEGHAVLEAETGVRHLPIQECQGYLATTRAGRGWEGPELWRERGFVDAFISDF